MFDCPFHSKGKRQDTASFGVQVETGGWNCFNPECGRKGPSIQSLYARLTGTAEEQVETLFPKDLGATDDLRRRLTSSNPQAAARALAPFPKVASIQDHEAARAYMRGRRIPESVWAKLGLGYCPDARMAGEYGTRTTMGGRRIVFPIRLPDGSMGFLGRSIGADPVSKWRPIENTGTFFYDPLGLIGSGAREAVLIEGEFSLAACVRESLPPLGCFGSRIGRDRFHLLHQFDRIVTLFDGDKAGREGQRASFAEAPADLRRKLVAIELPEGHDPASLPAGFGNAVRAKLSHVTSFAETLKGRLHA